jgi:hypothetical protein
MLAEGHSLSTYCMDKAFVHASDVPKALIADADRSSRGKAIGRTIQVRLVVNGGFSSGAFRHTTSSASGARRARVRGGAPAAMSLAGCLARTARRAAIMLAPVAMPLSTTMTRRPAGLMGGRIGVYNARRVRNVASCAAVSVAR